MGYAEVAVASPGAGRRTFCYSIPASLSVDVGQGVWVPFGPQVLQGVVLQLEEVPAVEQTKEIFGIIDPLPILSPAQVELAKWISQHYLSPLFAAVSLMLPPGFERKVLTFLELSSDWSEKDLSMLNPSQREAVAFLQEKGRVEKRALEKALGKREAGRVVDSLVRKGLVRKQGILEPVKVKPRRETFLRLTLPPAEALEKASSLKKRSPRQAALLELIAKRDKSFLDRKDKLLALSSLRTFGYSPIIAKALERQGFLSLVVVEVRRDPLAGLTVEPASLPLLMRWQEAALRPIKDALARDKNAGDAPVFLLHGVTGSGKTEVYLRALAEAIALGKKGIVLVPEIALTPQTIERFASRFPGRVAVLHSKLSLGEQYDEWRRIKAGDFDVVIGPRSALFAPQPDLGLIVIDEEHEWTYKQEEQPPFYHARDAAIKLARLRGAVVVLGSATPDLSSYHNALSGEFHLLELPSRITRGGETPLPEVEVVDMKEELKADNRGLFSRSLQREIGRSLGAKEQVILFLNRRGESTFVQCRTCGYVLRCRRCLVSLTYHRIEQSLICHQCNYKIKLPRLCPQCGSERIKFLGSGTQKVEEETAQLFPAARLLRWDMDVTRGRHSHEEILHSFRAGEADVLIGTQMIAKGLDLPQVTLVGVIMADLSLHFPDFRSPERTFQLLCQVAGRAGRGVRLGKVVFQTYSPQHYALQAAALQDYRAFYEKEIGYRRQLDNPPFSRLVRLLYTHPKENLCKEEAERIARLLREEKDSRGIARLEILGPSPAFHGKVRGRFRWQIFLRGYNPVALVEDLPFPRGWSIDVDPLSLL